MRMHPILRWLLNSSTDVMEFSSNMWTFFLALLVLLLLMLSSYLRLKSLFRLTILSQRSFFLSFVPCFIAIFNNMDFITFSMSFWSTLLGITILILRLLTLLLLLSILNYSLHYEAQSYVLNPLPGRVFGISACDEALQVWTEW